MSAPKAALPHPYTPKMLSVLIISFVAATVATLWTVRSALRHGHVSVDHDFSGPQKFHSRVVPRIGGIVIFIGLTTALLWIAWQSPSAREPLMFFVFCSLPVFGAGLIEDF